MADEVPADPMTRMTSPPHSADEELEPLVTECPSCLTRFRASEAQLQRAGGKVRCGACLTVFDGVAHLTIESAEVYGDDDQARRALDDVLDELAGDSETDTGADADVTAAPVTGEGRRGPPRGPIFSGYEEDELEEEATTADAGPDVETPEAAPASALAAPDEAEDSDADSDEPDVDYSFEVIGERDLAAARPGPEDAPSTQPEDAGPEPGRAVPAPWMAPANSATADSTVPDRPAEAGADETRGRTAAGRGAAASGRRPGSAARTGTVEGVASRSSAVADVDAVEEPVRFGEETVRRPLVWAGIAVGLLLLVAQVLWYQFDDWAKDPAWRAVYAPLCAVFRCELPQQRDLAQLATRNLAVRSDPDRPGTLRVNAIIVNEADFAQPFPVLELRFTTVRGMLVAGRRFQPEDYLAGDAVGMTLIPPKTPVQIELSIDDPGPEAVNYFLRFI